MRMVHVRMGLTFIHGQTEQNLSKHVPQCTGMAPGAAKITTRMCRGPGYVPHILSAMVIVNSGIVLVSRWFRVAFAILLSISSVSVLGTCSIIHPYMALTVTVLRLHALKSSW